MKSRGGRRQRANNNSPAANHQGPSKSRLGVLDPVRIRLHPVCRLGPSRAVSSCTFRSLLFSKGTIRGSMRRHHEGKRCTHGPGARLENMPTSDGCRNTGCNGDSKLYTTLRRCHQRFWALRLNMGRAGKPLLACNFSFVRAGARGHGRCKMLDLQGLTPR